MMLLLKRKLRRPTNVALVLAAVSCLIVGFCTISAVMLIEMRHDTGTQAKIAAMNLLGAEAQHVARDLELYDLSLQSVIEALARPELGALPPGLRQAFLFPRPIHSHAFDDIMVLDRQGTAIESSIPSLLADLKAIHFRDRDFFQAHLAKPGLGLFIGKPFFLPSGRALLTLSRRIDDPAGHFEGVVVGTVGLDYLQKAFGEASLGPSGRMTLIRSDGILLMRAPYNPASLGRDLSHKNPFSRMLLTSHGTFSAVSELDMKRRTFNFMHVGTLPLILNVAFSEHDLFLDWRRRATAIAAALLVLCATSLAVSVLLAREAAKRRLAEQELRLSEAQYRLLADRSTDVIIRLDQHLQRIYVSPSSCTVMGWEPAELVGRHPRDIVHPEDWGDYAAQILQAQRMGSNVNTSYRILCKNGRYLWVEGRYSSISDDGGFIAVIRDISKRKRAEIRLATATAELNRIAHSDSLTGIGNRRLFDEKLIEESVRAAREEIPLSLLLLDADRFKKFNDRYGHQSGDDCLRLIADAVQKSLHRPADFAARYGGEELVVLLPNTEAEGAMHVAQRIRAAIQAFAQPHADNQPAGVVTVSIGCMTGYPGSRTAMRDAQDLLAQADKALYEGKRRGRNIVCTPDMIVPPPSTAPDEALRLAEVDIYRRAIQAGRPEGMNRIARLAASLLDAPMAFISLIDAKNVVLVGRHGIDVETVPRGEAVSSGTPSADKPLIMTDLEMDGRLLVSNPAQDASELRFYAGNALISPHSSQRLGTLCIVDTKPRPPLDAAQQILLTDLARLAVEDMERSRVG